ncbi:uncharacterized protein [Rutidosis leptorrhynchoides]|uniref:uncharacterized protein n=1 Tax=Rutidosis leptorrhynchoides TaxID=125765 RepID=UPI003A99BEF2
MASTSKLGDVQGKTAEVPPTWASLFGDNRLRCEGNELSFVPPSVVDGVPVVRFHFDEIQSEVEKWKYTLVGSVYGDVPKFARFQQFVMNPRLVSVHQIEQIVFLLNFVSQVAQHEAIGARPLTFNRRLLLLMEWQPSMEFKLIEVTLIPIWVKLPKLPLVFWAPKLLSRVGSVLSKLLMIDQCTMKQTRLNYTRLLVKIDITMKFQKTVNLVDENMKQFVQDVEYEWMLKQCSVCGKKGHLSKICPMRAQPVVRPGHAAVVQLIDVAQDSYNGESSK